MDVHYNTKEGRHIATNKHLKAGEIVCLSDPFAFIVFDPNDNKRDISFQAHCVLCGHASFCSIPCPHCPDVLFCSMECLETALASHHYYECKMRLYGILNQLSKDVRNISVGRILVLRLITLKAASFFSEKCQQALMSLKNRVQ